MSKRKSLSELKKLIIEDISYQDELIVSFKSDKNPQVKEMHDKAMIRKESLEEVLEYINMGTTYQFSKRRED